jgi:hypothetical protein
VVAGKHRTEVTEATEGELEKGKWAGDMAAPSARSRISKKHRTGVTEATEEGIRTEAERVRRLLTPNSNTPALLAPERLLVT